MSTIIFFILIVCFGGLMGLFAVNSLRKSQISTMKKRNKAFTKVAVQRRSTIETRGW